MLVVKEAPLVKVIRLLCLQSIIENGLKQKSLDYFRREILQVLVIYTLKLISKKTYGF
jgi:hypothetical protein